MLWNFFRVLTLGAVVAAAADCESLIYREGVKVQCENPTTKEVLDCHGTSPQLPTGSTAKYNCTSKYYIAVNHDLEEDGGRLVCNNRGEWTGLPEFLSFSCAINCGLPQATTVLAQAQNELWPWHATIFLRENNTDNFKYICGGTLVKPYGKGYVILTAAHCLADQDGKVRQNLTNFKIVLGGASNSFEENSGSEQNIQIREVRDVVVHESYVGRSNGYQGDIAMVSMVQKIVLGPTVIPACFSKSVNILDIGAEGEVTGFGQVNQTDSSLLLTSQKLRNVTQRVVEPSLCFEWRQRKLTSQEICAGIENSEGVCIGDSGGGLMLTTNSNGYNRYYLQGIVSHGKRNFENGSESCDTYSLFTKVNSYANWIRDTAHKLFAEPEPAQAPFEPITSLPTLRDAVTVATLTTNDAEQETTNQSKTTVEETEFPAKLSETLPTATPEKFEVTNVTTETVAVSEPVVTAATVADSTSATTVTSTTSDIVTTTASTPANVTPVTTETSAASATVDTAEVFTLIVTNVTTATASSQRLTITETATATTETAVNPDVVMTNSTADKVESTYSEISFRTSKPERHLTVPIKTTPPSESTNQIEQYDLKSLERHNFYRSMHSADPLRLSAQMKEKAQAYAAKLIREGKFENQNENGLNKNVYYVTGTNVKSERAVVSAVDAWYDDIAAYNWDNPYYSTFSQVVWKATTDMGTGVATSGRRTIVVVAYYPAGNILGEDGRYFHDNVLPKTQNSTETS